MKSIFIRGIVISLLFSATAWARTYEDLTPAERTAISEEIRSTFRSLFIGDVYIGGEIVDDSSNLLSDVEVSIFLAEGNVPDWTTTVSEAFSFAFTNCSDVALSFAKDGYYHTSFRFSIGGDVPVSGSGVRIISNTNMRVVLGEIGPATSLREYRGKLQHAPGDLNVACQFIPRRNDRYIWETISDMRSNSLYVAADTVDGLIVATPVAAEEDGYRWTNLYAEALTLCATGNDSGFVTFTPNCEAEDREQVFRQMKDCPESGYTNVLHIVPAASEFFAYIRLGDLYGKGWFGGAETIPRSRTDVGMHYHLFIQPDGSRNVRSPE